ncbi:germination protein YpeB [Paenibacillus antri]|uniref:Germination protein YpeB n=1 Tax=Paenibacillus antri TaxID=2582848 RepID=A0A5R9GG03_9BACL|nr:germination protein YpeB [Paenibacillus antri]TLS53070.1 germination protein YpeB [Paenibacillus antri]
MYQRLSAVLFPIVAVLLVGAGLWGYQEHQEKNQILVKAENQYQRAFHDLSYHMDQLHEELGNTLAVSSASNFHRKGLINMWRLTSQAQSEVNQLPLTLMPFHETEELLANISKFSYKTAMRDLQKQPLTPAEMKILTTLYERSKEIKTDLRKVQESVLNNHLQWMDVEVLLASGEENYDNDIIDGFKLMNKRVTENGDIDWGPTMTAMNRRMSMQGVEGAPITAEDAKRKAADFLGLKDTSSMKTVENGADTEFTTYTVSVPANDRSTRQLEFTKAGGKLVYFLTERPVENKIVDIRGAVEAGTDFLQEHGYEGMRAVSYDEYNNVASIMFARVVNGVTVYPEKVTVKVALDDAEVTGLSAGELLFHPSTEKIGEPAMTEAEARKLLNPNFKVKDASLAVIRNDLDEEVLCYEFLGGINGGDYRIYFNADNGFEEKIERIRDSDAEASGA